MTSSAPRILFVDDEPRILDGLQAMLRRHRKRWQMHFACGAQAGLEALAAAPFDLVVSDIRMPGMDGAEFLTRVQQQHPDVMRIVLSGQTEPQVSRRLVNIAHQFLSKPCDSEKLCEVIDRATAVRALMQQTELRALVNSLGQLPSAPRIYHRLVALLEGDRGELAEVAGLLEEDPALAAKVLQVVNSAFFGLPQRIANVGQAITYLGTEMVKALVLSVEAGSALGAAPRTTGIDMDGLRRRDLTAARLCRKLLPDKAQADAAFTAALLQNVGLAILAARRSEALEGLLAEARATGRPIVEAERSALGTTHPELGAFLLGVWGLPMDVVNAVLHHQTPGGLSATRLDASGAVHVAAALVGEASPGGREDPLVPKLDAAYLAQVGATGQIEGWRGLARALVEGARA